MNMVRGFAKMAVKATGFDLVLQGQSVGKIGVDSPNGKTLVLCQMMVEADISRNQQGASF